MAGALVTLAATVATAACSLQTLEPGSAGEGPIGGAADGFDEAAGEDGRLGIPVPSDPFVFHPARQGLELENARWLAWMARNEYCHFEDIGPALEELGFGAPGEGSSWSAKAVELRALRESDPSEAALYELELVHKVHPGAMIEFFSGLEVDLTLVEGAEPPRCDLDGHCDRDGDGDIGAADLLLEEGSTQALWAQHRELPLVIVAFRGTEVGRRPEEIRDIIADLNLLEREVPGWGGIHRGFEAGLEEIYPLLAEKLREIEGTDVAVWVTGHSLGAALATAFSARVMDDMAARGARYDLRGVYTFGSPRVGDRRWAATFDRHAAALGVSSIRFRHADDIVTRIPEDLSFGAGGTFDFHHVGQMVFLRYDGELWYRPEDTAGITWRTRPADNQLADHDMGTYYARILGHARDAELAAELAGYELCGNGLDDDDDGDLDYDDATCADVERPEIPQP